MADTRSRSIRQSLLASSHTSSHQDLYDPVPPNTHVSLQRLAQYLGLETVQAVKQWLKSDQFRPLFNVLYENAIRPRKAHNPGLQGSIQTTHCTSRLHNLGIQGLKLLTVQAALQGG